MKAEKIFEEIKKEFTSKVGVEYMQYFPFGHLSFLHELNKRMLMIQDAMNKREEVKKLVLEMIEILFTYYDWLRSLEQE